MAKDEVGICSICGKMTTSKAFLKKEVGYDERFMCNDCLAEFARRCKEKGIEFNYEVK